MNKNSVLPAGELTLRMGAPESGEALMSVCFERGGSMTQPAGKIKITLPAELLTGYTLSLLNADGSQTPLRRFLYAGFHGCGNARHADPSGFGGVMLPLPQTASSAQFHSLPPARLTVPKKNKNLKEAIGMKKWMTGCLIAIVAVLMLGSALAAHEHNWQWAGDENSHMKQCAECKKVDEFTYAPHTKEYLWPATPPSNPQIPLEVPIRCSVCQRELKSIKGVPKRGTPSTCLTDGILIYGGGGGIPAHTYSDPNDRAVGHVFKNYTLDQEATCTADATETARCIYAEEGREPKCTATDTRTIPNTKLAHEVTKYDGKAATCTEIGWNAYEVCKNCDYTTYQEIPATGHSYLSTVTQPTCTKGGYTAHTCTMCGDSFIVRKTAALGHWYGEWTPGTDGTHTADCRRSGCSYQNAVACAAIACKLTADDQTVKEFTLCPVCGEVSDGARLTLAEGASAKGNPVPGSEALVRMGQTADGEPLMVIGFERGGQLTQPEGKVKFTLPAELLEGYTLRLLAENGAETELAFASKGKEASFTLDFADGDSPVKLIRLVPAA